MARASLTVRHRGFGRIDTARVNTPRHRVRQRAIDGIWDLQYLPRGNRGSRLYRNQGTRTLVVCIAKNASICRALICPSHCTALNHWRRAAHREVAKRLYPLLRQDARDARQEPLRDLVRNEWLARR